MKRFDKPNLQTVYVDVLQKKREELRDYELDFENTVHVFNNAIENMKAINTDIENTIEEIEGYEVELAKTKGGLSELATKNNKVIKNFEALLNVE